MTRPQVQFNCKRSNCFYSSLVAVFHSNLYWSAEDGAQSAAVFPEEKNWVDWQNSGNDTGSIWSQPIFRWQWPRQFSLIKLLFSEILQWKTTPSLITLLLGPLELKKSTWTSDPGAVSWRLKNWTSGTQQTYSQNEMLKRWIKIEFQLDSLNKTRAFMFDYNSDFGGPLGGVNFSASKLFSFTRKSSTLK